MLGSSHRPSEIAVIPCDVPLAVAIFPYLPLDQRVMVGPFELIPRGQLTADDSLDEEAAERARGLAALYRLDGNALNVGAFLRPEDGRVGGEFQWELSGPLYQAVLCSMLDLNPTRAGEQEENPNAGWGMTTTENAFVVWHGIDHEGHTAFRRGVMVSTLTGGYRVGENADVIEPPADLMLPFLGPPPPDPVYANALYDLLADPADDAPDLAGAIRWLGAAWLNDRDVGQETRILVLRAGFDVLFGDPGTRQVREALSALLSPADEPLTHRAWDDHGRAVQADLTDLAWWFVNFALLRNRIAHGGRLNDDDFEWTDGISHVWHAEWQLRRAIKETVARAGYPDVRLSEIDRMFRDLGRDLANSADDDASDPP